MDFPKQVVQHIYTVTTRPRAFSPPEPALDLQDRLRGQAVCRAWREWLCLGDGWQVAHGGECYLSPFRLPSRMGLLGMPWITATFLPLGWVQSARPALRAVLVVVDEDPLPRNLEWEDPRVQAVFGALGALQCQALERLELGMRWPFMEQFWPVVCGFPRLRQLLLIVYPKTPGAFDDPDGTLDGRMLAALPPSLEHLTAEGLKRFESKGPGLLPALEELHVRDTERVVVNAALPGLKLLGVHDSEKVWLRGASLALPQLTRLWLGEQGIFMTAQVDFSAMPALAELSVAGLYRLSAAGGGALTDLFPLQRLTLLSLGDCKLDTALGLLHLAPPTLPELDATWCYPLYDNDDFVAALGSLTQLTRLHLRDASLAARLEHLQDLRELHLDCYAEPQSGRYSGLLREQDIAPLGRLRGLRRLRMEILPHHQATEEQGRRLQALARALPAECVIEGRRGMVYNPPA